MFNRLSCMLITTFLAGCATSQAYSDATNAQERKAYIACAVSRAFLSADDSAAPEDIARRAMVRCESERHAVMLKLIEENADKPFGMKFVEAYMNELHATMIDHIALRLAQSRPREHKGTGV